MTNKTAAAFADIERTYANGDERPLGGYVRAMGAYGVMSGILLLIARSRGKRIPAGPSISDFALMALATHKAARILAKDSVTSPLRAPFTQYEEPAGAGEVNERVIAPGWKHAVGELIECPFCLAVWFATLLAAGLVIAPRFTRWVCAIFSAVAVSDSLQFAYDALKKSE